MNVTLHKTLLEGQREGTDENKVTKYREVGRKIK